MDIDTIFAMVFNHPITYLIIIIIGTYFILGRYNQGKLKPEQKPDFGVKFRAKRTKEHLDKREKCFAEKFTEYKAKLYHGIRPLGRVLTLENIPRNNPSNVMLYLLTYRRFGFGAWFLSLFGFGKNRILVDSDSVPETWDEDKKEVKYVIDKHCFFRERGGIMFLSKDIHKKFIDEINADADYENAKGFVSDFPRRLSNLSPAHAMKTDTMELDSQLDERAEDKKRFIWGKGG